MGIPPIAGGNGRKTKIDKKNKKNVGPGAETHLREWMRILRFSSEVGQSKNRSKKEIISFSCDERKILREKTEDITIPFSNCEHWERNKSMSHDSGHRHHDWQNDPPPGGRPFMRGSPFQQNESIEPIGLPKMRRAPPRRTDHTYHNFSNYPVANLPRVLKSPTKFPSKLHHILSDPECHHVSQIRKVTCYDNMAGASQVLLLIN